MRTTARGESVSVLDRLSAILDTFGSDKVLGINEIARRANLPKSTVSRIAAELVERNWLDRIGNDFYVGLSLYELGQAVTQPRLLREVAQPHIAKLRHATGETVQLCVLDGDAVVRVAAAPGRQKPPLKLPLGERLPAHANASGKALLAFTADALPAAPEDGLEARTAYTVTRPLTLQRQLAEIRRTRIAIDHEECTLGVSSAASPIFGSDGVPIGAVAIVGLAEGFDTATTGRLVRSAALQLSRQFS